MKRLVLLIAAMLVAHTGWIADASAHAEEPTAEGFAAIAGEDAWLLEANFGVTSSAFSNEYVCEEAFLGGDTFLVAPLGPDEWVTFGDSSIHRTEDGCNFEKVADLSDAVTDAVADPETGRVAYVSNRDGDRGIWVSEDRGASFAKIDFDVSQTRLTGIRFADGSTLLVSAYDETEQGAALWYQVDIGAGSVEPVTLPDGLTYPYLLDAAGGNVVWHARSDVARVYVGPIDDPAAHELEAPGWPTGAALSEDGETVWVGIAGGEGLRIGDVSDSGVSWETAASGVTVNCVGRSGDDIFLCTQRKDEGADLLRLTDEGTAPVVNFAEFSGPRSSCPDDSDVGSVCPLVWEDFARYLGIDPDQAGEGGHEDGGHEEGHEDDGHVHGEDDSHGDASCATPGGSDSFPLGVMVFLLVLTVLRSHSKRSGSRS